MLIVHHSGSALEQRSRLRRGCRRSSSPCGWRSCGSGPRTQPTTKPATKPPPNAVSMVITIIYVPPSSSLQREGTRGNPESYLDRDYKTHKEVHEICLFCDHDLREDFSLFPRRRHSAHIAQLKQHSILQA